MAVDAATGTTLYARNADDDFIPASTLKLIVGSAALARLGPDFSFVTTVAADGTVRDGTLHGDLYLRGGGDAQLTRADLDAAAAAIRAAGIAHVSGSLVGDASRYDAPRYPPGWTIDDIPYGYAAVPGALSLDLNIAHLTVAPGESAGAPAALHLVPNGSLLLENATVTGARGSEDTTDLARPWNEPGVVRVTGSYPLGAPASDDLDPAVPDPAAYVLAAFRDALAARGVRVDRTRMGIAPPAATVMWKHRSKPLALLLRDFWPPSTNLIGEQLLEEFGTTADARGADTRDRGIALELDWLRSAGVDPRSVTIVDGSGLSAYDRVTPRALIGVLQSDWQSPRRDTVVSALAVAGVSGTLQTTFTQTPLLGAVFAKTGSSNHSRLLAGYARRPDGGTTTFALMINDWMDASPGAGKALEAARAAVLTALLAP